MLSSHLHTTVTLFVSLFCHEFFRALFRGCGSGFRYLLRRVSFPPPFLAANLLFVACCYLSLSVGWCSVSVLVMLCCSWRRCVVSSGGGGGFGLILEVGCGLCRWW
ncbi:hypothetical protein QL285_052862 [Trifolium repens]|nr:hypothetical protein QL285_052862 [Trifolium repens]